MLNKKRVGFDLIAFRLKRFVLFGLIEKVVLEKEIFFWPKLTKLPVNCFYGFSLFFIKG